MTTWSKLGDAGSETTAGSQLSNVLNLVYTDDSGLGIIKKEGVPFIHDYKHSTGLTVAPDGANTFVGENAGGNMSMGNLATDIAHGSYNVGVGYRAALSITLGQANTGVGYRALQDLTTGNHNTAVGKRCLHDLINGDSNVGVGRDALFSTTSGNYSVAVGYQSLYASNSDRNVAVGHKALFSGTTITDSVAIGYLACRDTTVGDKNVAVGANAMLVNIAGGFNVAVGKDAMVSSENADQCVAVGYQALHSQVSGTSNTAIGWLSLRYFTDGTAAAHMTNCAGLGADSRVSGDNQVQLGDSNTTVYAYGAIQNRSDRRDKAQIRNTTLGLSFIQKLRPVDFKWDLREDYSKVDRSNGRVKREPKDGRHQRTRFHHGLIAQEVEKVLTENGIDFGGFQNHSVNGGSDVMSLGYTEFIAPLIKAVQELAARVEFLEQQVNKGGPP